MPEDPYDDFLKNLARMVEEIISTMPEQGGTRFIGCTIITGSPGGHPQVIPMQDTRPEEIEYEMIESEDRVFITAKIPPDITTASFADITPDRITIVAGDRSVVIELDSRIDVIHSFYEVRHDVIDIVLRKKVQRAGLR